ncbi:MAG TPA: hypothetical protein VFI30_02870 [Nocardioidaceae bacterium]|nr:hypothetical protein [Nocardioidaceae bacterium]
MSAGISGLRAVRRWRPSWAGWPDPVRLALALGCFIAAVCAALLAVAITGAG